MNKVISWLTIPRLIVTILFITVFTMAVRVPADTDTWWHLRSGQYIVETGSIFTADPFSHTKLGQPWFYPKLGQVLWYGLFALAGWIGLSLGLTVLVTVAFGLVWLITPGNIYIRAFAIILGGITSALIWAARPQMFSFVLAALVLVLLERYKRTGSRWIYLLPIITALWGNLHGGYAVAFMLAAVYLIGEIGNRLTRQSDAPTLSWRQIGLLGGVTALSLLTVALNPYGWQMWVYPLRTVGIDVLRDFIQEWRSPNFHTTMTWPFAAMLVLTLIIMGATSRLVDWTDVLMVGLWLAASLLAVRNVGLYGLLTVPILARYGDAALAGYLPPTAGKRPPIFAYLNWLLLGLVTLAALVRVGLMLPSLSEAKLTENLPARAVQFIQERTPPGPLFNSYNWGGYLIFKLWPQYSVYIDGRTDLYDDAFIRRYLDVMAANEGWQQTLADDGINLVLIETNSTLARFLRRDLAWREVYRDDMAAIFVRQVVSP